MNSSADSPLRTGCVDQRWRHMPHIRGGKHKRFNISHLCDPFSSGHQLDAGAVKCLISAIYTISFLPAAIGCGSRKEFYINDLRYFSFHARHPDRDIRFPAVHRGHPPRQFGHTFHPWRQPVHQAAPKLGRSGQRLTTFRRRDKPAPASPPVQSVEGGPISWTLTSQ